MQNRLYMHSSGSDLWKFKQYTDSRWLSLGHASKRMVAAQLLGITAMLTFALSQPHVSGFFLNQFWRSQEENCWEFLAEASLVSQVPDAVVALLMQDNRVARTAPDLEMALLSKLMWLIELDLFVFEKLARLSGCSGAVLRGNCVRAAHKCIAFFRFRVLSVANALPWTLVRGNILENLQSLAASPKPSNVAAGKLWELMRLGCIATSILVRMVVLLGRHHFYCMHKMPCPPGAHNAHIMLNNKTMLV
jgi:hypothetical protein